MTTAPFDTLPRLKWRGQELPISARSVSFAHENVQHKLQRRNQDLIEQTGAHNLVFSYTIPMREGLFKGPYQNLFTEKLAVLFRDCRNRTPGELIDPYYGIRRAVPASYMDETDIQRRDGVDIRIEFTDAPLDDESETSEIPTVQSLFDDGRTVEVALQEMIAAPANAAEEAAVQEFKQIESERPTTDVLSALNGIGRQVILLGDRANNAIDDVIFRAEKLQATAQKLTTPAGWIVRDRSRRLRDNAYRVNRARLAQFNGRRVTNTQPRSVASLAAAYRLTVQEFLALNPELARSPTVPRGAVIVVPLADSPNG